MNRTNIYFLYFAWAFSLAGAVLSFYFGEILRFEPCVLCWYQRMNLFPLVVVLGVGVYRGDLKIASYGMYFAFFGFIVALYQVLEPYVPFLQTAGVCGEVGACLDPVFVLFGFLTFPMISGIGFLFIFFLLWFAQPKHSDL